MADSVEPEVSSSTPLFSDEVHHYQAEPDQPEPGQPKPDLFTMDDIVDLVGGAQDALDRHRAEDSAPHESTETPTVPEEEPVTLPEPVHVTAPEPEPEPEPVPEPVHVSAPEPEPVHVTAPEPVPEPEPEPVHVTVPEPEPVHVPEPVSVPEVKKPEPVPVVETAIPDSTSPPVVPEPAPVPEEPKVVAPVVEPESIKIAPEPQAVPEPQAAPEPEPAPQSDALPAAEPRKAAAAPAEEAPAPASYEPSPSKAQPRPLMHFPTVVDLLYWRDVKTTGVVFGAALLLLLSLMACSIVSVCSYIGLALLSVTICFRIYKGILQAIQKSDEGHPFKQYLDQEVALSEDMVHKYSDMVLARLNKTIGDLRRLFLVEDLVDSIKFAVLMWILTYVGALFNGLTLLILGLIGVFSCPIIYEKHQAQIDHYVALVNNQVKDVIAKIQAKVPGMKRKTE